MGISNTFVLGTDLGTLWRPSILAEVRHSARSRLDPKDDKRVLWYVFVSCCEVRLRAEICSHCLIQPYLDHDNHGNLMRCFLAFPHT